MHQSAMTFERGEAAGRQSGTFVSRAAWCVAIGLVVIWGDCARAVEKKSDRVSFRNDVVPILTKLGCNQGACHGSQHGKRGFKLSLLGFEAESDYTSIVKSAEQRRVSPFAPEESLLIASPAVPTTLPKRRPRSSWASAFNVPAATTTLLKRSRHPRSGSCAGVQP